MVVTSKAPSVALALGAAACVLLAAWAFAPAPAATTGLRMQQAQHRLTSQQRHASLVRPAVAHTTAEHVPGSRLPPSQAQPSDDGPVRRAAYGQAPSFPAMGLKALLMPAGLMLLALAATLPNLLRSQRAAPGGRYYMATATDRSPRRVAMAAMGVEPGEGMAPDPNFPFATEEEWMLIPGQQEEEGDILSLDDLQAGCVIIMGRNRTSGATYFKPSWKVSERIAEMHCKIDFWDGAHWIEDLGTETGTFLNGEQIPANEPVKIDIGDKIRLGPEDPDAQFEVITKPREIGGTPGQTPPPFLMPGGN